jgi:hypothetical protein
MPGDASSFGDWFPEQIRGLHPYVAILARGTEYVVSAASIH